MRNGILTVATCQFAQSANPRRNATQVCRQITQAKAKGAHLAHFPESALTGYPGAEMESFDGYDWDLLRAQTQRVLDAARRARMWVVVGSAHPLTGGHKPHNCVYVISPEGAVVDRYDKRFCTGGDLRHYSPGDHFTTFTARGVKCGVLICYDIRFPELYREYKKLGVQLMLHSFHNAAGKGPTIHTIIMRRSCQCRAATNYMWISANNASNHYQLWPSGFITPDGRVAGQGRLHAAAVLVHTVNTSEKFYDASRDWRDRCMRGILHSGTLVKDPRSRSRKGL
jgi:predicted amidohydrolase